MNTTIQISNEVKAYLDKMKTFEKETYNELIMNMIEDDMEINEKTARELDSRKLNREKTISQEEVKRKFGL